MPPPHKGSIIPSEPSRGLVPLHGYLLDTCTWLWDSRPARASTSGSHRARPSAPPAWLYPPAARIVDVGPSGREGPTVCADTDHFLAAKDKSRGARDFIFPG